MLFYLTCYLNFQLVFAAVNVSQTVHQLENTQKNMDATLSTQSQLLSDIQLGLETNVQTMKAAIQKLETNLLQKK